MKLVYLASPYSHPCAHVMGERFHAVCIAAAKHINAGYLVFSPIAHTHPIAMKGNLPLGWEYWAEYDRRMIESCDELHVLQLDGWDVSKGVIAEMQIAFGMGKPVFAVDPSSMEIAELHEVKE